MANVEQAANNEPIAAEVEMANGDNGVAVEVAKSEEAAFELEIIEKLRDTKKLVCLRLKDIEASVNKGAKKRIHDAAMQRTKMDQMAKAIKKRDAELKKVSAALKEANVVVESAQEVKLRLELELKEAALDQRTTEKALRAQIKGLEGKLKAAEASVRQSDQLLEVQNEQMAEISLNKTYPSLVHTEKKRKFGGLLADADLNATTVPVPCKKLQLNQN